MGVNAYARVCVCMCILVRFCQVMVHIINIFVSFRLHPHPPVPLTHPIHILPFCLFCYSNLFFLSLIFHRLCAVTGRQAVWVHESPSKGVQGARSVLMARWRGPLAVATAQNGACIHACTVLIVYLLFKGRAENSKFISIFFGFSLRVFCFVVVFLFFGGHSIYSPFTRLREREGQCRCMIAPQREFKAPALC